MALNTVTVSVPLAVWKEGNQFVSFTPALDLSSCGSTEQEAIEKFAEAVAIFIETAVERNCLEELLEAYGWVCQDDDWEVPFESARGSAPFEFSLPRPHQSGPQH